jgi:hypothetical protein
MSYFLKHQKLISEKLKPLEKYCQEIYVFGSCLLKDNPQDIDIVLVYEDQNLKILQTIKNQITYELPFHFTFLNSLEMQEDNLFTRTVKSKGQIIFKA